MHKKLGFLFAAALIITLAVPAAVDAKNSHHRYHSASVKKSYTSSYNLIWGSTSSTTSPAPVSAATPTLVVSAPVSLGQASFTAYITGYSYWDNTPPGSGDISHPTLHDNAGGTGTYADPITIAVGHSITGGKDILDYPAGTRFYLPYLHKYAIVEDTCGDGNAPQNGPCHSGYQGHAWLDIYVDGKASRSAADACMNKLTGLHAVIKDPAATYPVSVGSITTTGCTLF